MTISISAPDDDAGRPCVIRGARLLDPNRWHGVPADILIISDSIAAIAPGVEAPEGALALDGTGLLIHPAF